MLHQNISHIEPDELFSLRRSMEGGLPEIWATASPFHRQAGHSGCKLGPYHVPQHGGFDLMGHHLFISAQITSSCSWILGCCFCRWWKVDVWPPWPLLKSVLPETHRDQCWNWKCGILMIRMDSGVRLPWVQILALPPISRWPCAIYLTCLDYNFPSLKWGWVEPTS